MLSIFFVVVLLEKKNFKLLQNFVRFRVRFRLNLLRVFVSVCEIVRLCVCMCVCVCFSILFVRENLFFVVLFEFLHFL